MDILVDIFNYLMDKWTSPWTIVDIRGHSWTVVDNRGHMDIFVDIFMDICMDICMDMYVLMALTTARGPLSSSLWLVPW
jgi:hypothetical protein